MAETQAGPSTAPPIVSTTATDQASHAHIRNRFSRQNLHQRLSSSSRPRRRSSILSFGSIDGGSFHEDVIQPSTTRRTTDTKDHEITHWSSTPLAFAILPAVSGLVFKNGSAFVTDVLLLTLAAVFMNWSIRVPREWYHSAQVIRRDIEPNDDPLEQSMEESAIIEEEEENDEEKPSTSTEDKAEMPYNPAREQAASSLRRQELLALLACFVFPVAAAYLLHVIRAQLSRPSESVVSDYNLSIFVLAAEFWPARQVIRLVAARTLHLQRIVTALDDPVTGFVPKGTTYSGFLSRIEALETQLLEAAPAAGTPTPLQPADLAGLDAKIQKRLEPRLDSLERAVRRYEKRYTTLAMVTEQRFQSLETRMQDTLSLAAVAAQHSQGSTSILRSLLTTSLEIITLPAKLAWELVTWPVRAADEVFDWVKVLMLGPRASSRKDVKLEVPRSEIRIKDDKLVREKSARKLARA